jgi:nitrogen fixation protein FixH
MALTSDAHPRVGACNFDISVKGPGGIPVADAEVTAEIYMPLTPSMGKTSTRMASEGNGRYEAIGTLATAGPWKVTVTAKRGNQVLGTKTFDVVAKE